MSFCAICLSPRGPFTREPLGKDDALVLACVRCTSESVVPREAKAAARGVIRYESLTDTQVRIRANRDRLYADGLCVNGRAHGAREPGRRLCSSCIAKAKSHEKKRTRGRVRAACSKRRRKIPSRQPAARRREYEKRKRAA